MSKKWIKNIIVAVLVVAAGITIFNAIPKKDAEDKTTTGTSTETACVAVVDMEI